VFSIIACDLLTPHTSTVTLKSTFSTDRRMLTNTRNRPVSEAIEMSICGNDWLD